MIPIKPSLAQQLAPPSTIKRRLEGRSTLRTQDGANARYPACIPSHNSANDAPSPAINANKACHPDTPTICAPPCH
ncbi:hypothetical protein RRG08_043494 [Elysia crispata]|uniref:Uncharacterized protein n=1 Tax=Elysia crispata TaxID=231223 RepID=A0AAE1CXN9_9GAST|nr:hypothetical protein RRG08_043494 [Elysia crispata]